MKYAEIQELTSEELSERILEEKQNLVKMQFSHAASALENPLKIKAIRKDIARLLTELSKRTNEVKANTI